MKIIRFNVAEDTDSGAGNYGLVPDFVNTYLWTEFNPLKFGMTVAHDSLEHHRNESGQVWEEMRAFGAIMYVRRWDEWFNQNNSFVSYEDSLATDITLMGFMELHHRNEFMPEPRRVILKGEDRENFDYWIPKIKRSVLRQLIQEASGYDSETVKAIKDCFRENWHRVEGWFKVGFQDAKRRYEYRGENAYDLFCSIEQCIDDYKFYDIEEVFYSGGQYVLRYDEYTATLTPEIPKDYYSDYY